MKIDIKIGRCHTFFLKYLHLLIIVRRTCLSLQENWEIYLHLNFFIKNFKLYLGQSLILFLVFVLKLIFQDNW